MDNARNVISQKYAHDYIRDNTSPVMSANVFSIDQRTHADKLIKKRRIRNSEHARLKRNASKSHFSQKTGLASLKTEEYKETTNTDYERQSDTKTTLSRITSSLFPGAMSHELDKSFQHEPNSVSRQSVRSEYAAHVLTTTRSRRSRSHDAALINLAHGDGCYPLALRHSTHLNTTSSAMSGANISPIECVIMLSFFAIWFFAIILFIRKWHHLKLIQPREHTLRQKPKNLESVKVVKRSSDSVIYNAYPVAMTRTMALREKRLERMHTMPAIKVDPEEKSPAKAVKRDLDIGYSRSVPAGMLYLRCLNTGQGDDEIFCSSAQEQQPMLLVNNDT